MLTRSQDGCGIWLVLFVLPVLPMTVFSSNTANNKQTYWWLICRTCNLETGHLPIKLCGHKINIMCSFIFLKHNRAKWKWTSIEAAITVENCLIRYPNSFWLILRQSNYSIFNLLAQHHLLAQVLSLHVYLQVLADMAVEMGCTFEQPYSPTCIQLYITKNENKSNVCFSWHFINLASRAGRIIWSGFYCQFILLKTEA